jgi:hypothetical protein
VALESGSRGGGGEKKKRKKLEKSKVELHWR